MKLSDESPRPQTRVLDLKGLKCPLPALHTRRALASSSPGAQLLVLATDPMSAIDVPHAAAQAGGRLLAQERDGDVLSFRILKQD